MSNSPGKSEKRHKNGSNLCLNQTKCMALYRLYKMLCDSITHNQISSLAIYMFERKLIYIKVWILWFNFKIHEIATNSPSLWTFDLFSDSSHWWTRNYSRSCFFLTVTKNPSSNYFSASGNVPSSWRIWRELLEEPAKEEIFPPSAIVGCKAPSSGDTPLHLGKINCTSCRCTALLGCSN